MKIWLSGNEVRATYSLALNNREIPAGTPGVIDRVVATSGSDPQFYVNFEGLQFLVKVGPDALEKLEDV